MAAWPLVFCRKIKAAVAPAPDGILAANCRKMQVEFIPEIAVSGYVSEVCEKM